jgi:hypothetical protein
MVYDEPCSLCAAVRGLLCVHGSGGWRLRCLVHCELQVLVRGRYPIVVRVAVDGDR